MSELTEKQLIQLKTFANTLERTLSAQEAVEKMGFGVHQQLEMWLKLANECYENEGTSPFGLKGIALCMGFVNELCGYNKESKFEVSFDSKSNLKLLQKYERDY